MSLLTQFYPGPGGGGGVTESEGVYTSVPTVIFGGGTSGLTGANGQLVGSRAYTYPVSNPTAFVGITGGTYKYVTVNNAVVDALNFNSSTVKAILNNSYVGSFNSLSAGVTSLTGIYGAGTIGSLDFPSTSSSPSFTTVSTDIAVYGTFIQLYNLALDAASLNHILVSLVNTGGTSVAGTLVATGGTSAGDSTLTTAGLAAKNALILAGWTVTLRP